MILLLYYSIIYPGDAADGMYFIEEGTVSIKMLQDGGEKEISKLEKGQYFGELALVTHKPRAASAYAQSSNVKVACKLYLKISTSFYYIIIANLTIINNLTFYDSFFYFSFISY